jgi:hypothetical protein
LTLTTIKKGSRSSPRSDRGDINYIDSGSKRKVVCLLEKASIAEEKLTLGGAALQICDKPQCNGRALAPEGLQQ